MQIIGRKLKRRLKIIPTQVKIQENFISTFCIDAQQSNAHSLEKHR